MLTRRLALFRILAGSTVAAAATTATIVAAPPVEAREESREPFKHPAEYLAAMQAIKWRPVAMYQRMPDGSAHRMGVNESAPSPEEMTERWRKFHAIQMRCPVQLPADVHPDQDWWKAVWQYLYDKGLRQDVTPPKAALALSEGVNQ
ncbi:MAG: hypothetical protein WBA48_00670 [Xanthobacteraceae bacterium]